MIIAQILIITQEGAIPVRALCCVAALAAPPVALHVRAPETAGKRAWRAPVRLYARIFDSPVKIQSRNWYSHPAAGA